MRPPAPCLISRTSSPATPLANAEPDSAGASPPSPPPPPAALPLLFQSGPPYTSTRPASKALLHRANRCSRGGQSESTSSAIVCVVAFMRGKIQTGPARARARQDRLEQRSCAALCGAVPRCVRRCAALCVAPPDTRLLTQQPDRQASHPWSLARGAAAALRGDLGHYLEALQYYPTSAGPCHGPLRGRSTSVPINASSPPWLPHRATR